MVRERVTQKSAKFDEKKREVVIVPMNENQKDYLNALKTSQQVVVLGPAGTGKTYIAASFAASLYLNKKVDKIILTRPNIAAGRSIGFFPGTLEEKMAPWVVPVMEVLVKHLGHGVVETGMKNGNIEIQPFETMRGRSFEDAFVLLDEAQNTTNQEIKMFLTRVGENCRIVMNGDIMQSDVSKNSGLTKTIEMIDKYDIPVPIIEFGVEDIVRSGLCKMWVEAFIKEDKE